MIVAFPGHSCFNWSQIPKTIITSLQQNLSGYVSMCRNLNITIQFLQYHKLNSHGVDFKWGV